MLKSKLALSILCIATALSTSTAFANHPDFDRGGFGGPGRYRCQVAQQNLANAQAALNQAVMILSQVQNICGDAIACIITAQNHYNKSLQNQQNAQREVQVACRGGHVPPPPHHGGGWGHGGGGWGHGGGGWGRPVPPPPPGRPGPGQPGPGRPGHGGRGGFTGGGFQGGPDMPLPDGGQGDFPPVVIGQ